MPANEANTVEGGAALDRFLKNCLQLRFQRPVVLLRLLLKLLDRIFIEVPYEQVHDIKMISHDDLPAVNSIRATVSGSRCCRRSARRSEKGERLEIVAPAERQGTAERR